MSKFNHIFYQRKKEVRSTKDVFKTCIIQVLKTSLRSTIKRNEKNSQQRLYCRLSHLIDFQHCVHSSAGSAVPAAVQWVFLSFSLISI